MPGSLASTAAPRAVPRAQREAVTAELSPAPTPILGGAMSGTPGASPFCILATAPELPTSTSSSLTRSRSTGLALRRGNSGNCRTPSGNLDSSSASSTAHTASAPPSRRLTMAGVGWRVLAVFVVLQLTWLLLRPASVLHTDSLRTRATHSLASLWAPHTDTREATTAAAATAPATLETAVEGEAIITNPATIMTADAAQAAALERAKALDGSARAKAVRVEPLLTAARNGGGAAGDAASATNSAGAGVDAPAMTQIGASFRVPVVPFPGRQANPPPVVGVVFYGRRSRVRILDCYLQRNLVPAGGLLSEVVFVSATWDRGDLDFLDRLLQLRKPYYRKLVPERLDQGYTGHYAWMDPGTLYVKIDDDVVYVADHAIDHMLQAHNLNRYHLISANVINHQPLELPHSQKGAHTVWEQAVKGDKTSWRQVMRPAAHQPTPGTNGVHDATSAASLNVVPATTTTPVPAGGVRMEAVPFVDNGWDVWGDWARAANVHYSFLDNERAGRLKVYEFPEPEGNLWDFNAHVGYIRWRINMIMFKGSTIDVHVYNMSSTTGTYPGDDEDYITRILPQQLNRTSAAASGALAVHFSFYPQREGLENSTDLLDRYALLAERTCGSLVPAEISNRKLRF